MRTRTSLLAAAALGLAACAGNTNSSQTPPNNTTSVGLITGFGSIFVNGVEYDTTNTTFKVEGQTVAQGEDALHVGMVVTLEGSVNPDGLTGKAVTVSFADEIEGVVLQNNIPAGARTGTINVMGQTVTVTADTVFKSQIPGITGVDQLTATAPSHVVEVSGYASGGGTIYATRIEAKRSYADGEVIELKGVVSNRVGNTFRLGGLIVDFSNAYEGVEADPVDGLHVEVRGRSVPSDNGDGTYTFDATRVEIEDDGKFGHHGEEGEEAELQGLVTSVDKPASFTLNGQTVLLGGETYEDDGSIDQLIAGAQVEVEGWFDANGNLVAKEIEFDGQTRIEFEGFVDAVDASTLSVFGQTVTVTPTTRMIDEQNDDKYFNLSKLNPSEFVELGTFRDGTGALVATKLIRNSDSGSVKLSGNVSQYTDNTNFQVEGIQVSNPSGAVTGGTLALDTAVEVTGSYAGGVITATNVDVD